MKKKLFLSASTTLLLFVLPFALGVYFVTTRYSERFILEQQINYFDVQNNWLGQLFLDQKWIGWFNRFMDFAIWGVLAAVVLLAVWLFSAAKNSMKNHYAEESFRNFSIPKTTWHSHFVVVVVMKVLLVLIALVSIFSLLAQAIPLLETNITIILQGYTNQKLGQVFLAGLFIVFLEYLILTCLKVFRLVHGDD